MKHTKLSRTFLEIGIVFLTIGVLWVSYDLFMKNNNIIVWGKIDKIVLNNNFVELNIGDKYSLDYFVEPVESPNKIVYFKTSNPSIATVSNNGVITAISDGTVDIIVYSSDETVSETCTVVVKKKNNNDNNKTIKVNSISFNDKNISIEENQEMFLKYNINPSNATNKNVTWKSSDSSIVSVINGKIKGLKEGNATITVTTSDGNKTDTCNIVVKKKVVTNVSLTNVSFVNKSVSISVGQDKSLEYIITPNNATNKSVTFSSSDNNIVSIVNGKIRGVKVGSATITITTSDGNKTDTCTVNVVNKVNTVAVKSISLNNSTLSISVNEEKNLTYTINPSDATNKNVTWSSSNSSIVSVNNGTIKGLKAGSATITVTTSDGGKKATCSVTVKASDKYPVPSTQNINVSSKIDPTTWPAIDNLGRSMTLNNGNHGNKYVGMFYWTWHENNGGTNGANRPINLNSLSISNPGAMNDYNNAFWKDKIAAQYWWNEPLYGYYRGSDDYVLRKHAELLADAGIDFIVFDCTNATLLWTESYMNLLKVWSEAKSQGVNVPKVAFMLPFWDTANTKTDLTNLWNDLYSKNLYKDLWFMYNGKPFIIAMKSAAPNDTIRNFFEFRQGEPSYFVTGKQANGKWGWLSTYPQAAYKKANGDIEQISVGVAQNACYDTNQLCAMNGRNIMGRSYAKGDYSYSYTYNGKNITVNSTIANSKLYGRNFQQQFDYAISMNPEVIFVTGWNEWIAGRFETWQGTRNAFPDEFNDEYSRDIEPSKGDLKDNYYYQLVDNVRKFKGTGSTLKNTYHKTINSISDFNDQNISVYKHYVGLKNRNGKEWGGSGKYYTNNSARNDITEAKVTYDETNIYFYVKCNNNITSYTDDRWMYLLIDIGQTSTHYQEFEYIVNKTKGTDKKLKLEKFNGGWSSTVLGDVDYKVSGKEMMVTIPRKLLGFTSEKISFNFKWTDNTLKDGDFMSIYTDGDAAPGGRFKFNYTNI